MLYDTEDFILVFSGDGAGGFRGRVAASPFGSGEDFELTPPWPAAELAALPDRVAQWIRQDAAGGRSLEYAKLGAQLSAWLFGSPAGAKLAASLHRLNVPGAGRRRRGLRLRLVFTEGTEALAALPWELLEHGVPPRRLVDRPSVSIVRAFELPEGGAPSAFELDPPLRVLLIGAAPQERGAAPDPSKGIDPEREQREIEAVSRLEVVDLDLFRGATLGDLRARLEQGDFHVVHFTGHGCPSREDGGWNLLFEEAQGERRDVSTAELVGVLSGLRSLRLVVLNSCRSAKLAKALLDAGVGAVVAMQVPIEYVRACDFSSQFYEELTAGFPIEDAVGSFRRAAEAYSSQWLAPVVFLGGASSDLFDLPPHGAKAGERLQLGIRSFIEKEDGHPPAFAKGMERESHRFLSLSSCFEGRPIRHPALWQSRVEPTLQRFLSEVAEERRPLLLDFAAHQTIAFTAGHYLGTNCGVDIVIRQRGPRGTEVWNIMEGDVPSDPLWALDPQPRDGALGPDVALVIQISRPGDMRHEVSRYLAGLETHQQIGRLLYARISGDGSTSVLSGRHALILAEELEGWVRQESPRRDRTLHLFAAVPNGFFFLLGRLSRNLGRIQLYEYGMGDPNNDTYSPSLTLPPRRFEPVRPGGLS